PSSNVHLNPHCAQRNYRCNQYDQCRPEGSELGDGLPAAEISEAPNHRSPPVRLSCLSPRFVVGEAISPARSSLFGPHPLSVASITFAPFASSNSNGGPNAATNRQTKISTSSPRVFESYIFFTRVI